MFYLDVLFNQKHLSWPPVERPLWPWRPRLLFEEFNFENELFEKIEHRVEIPNEWGTKSSQFLVGKASVSSVRCVGLRDEYCSISFGISVTERCRMMIVYHILYIYTHTHIYHIHSMIDLIVVAIDPLLIQPTWSEA